MEVVLGGIIHIQHKFIHSVAVKTNLDMSPRKKGHHCVSWILGLWLSDTSGERPKQSFAQNLFQTLKVKLVSKQNFSIKKGSWNYFYSQGNQILSLVLLFSRVTNLDSILKSRDITLPTKVHLVKAMVFPVVMYACESWTVKKAEC